MLKILIVEDEKPISDLIRLNLTKAGYNCTALYDGKAAADIFKDAVDKMVDHSCDPETEDRLWECVIEQEGVKGVDMLHTRMFGNKIYVDIEIAVDGDLTLRKAHAIAERVHTIIEQEFPKVKHIMVHVNPYDGETAPADEPR